MDKNRLLEIARQYLIFDDGQGETQLIRRIQQARGESACFATPAAASCDQTRCLWREECLGRLAAGRPGEGHEPR